MEADGLLDDLDPEDVARAVKRYKRTESDLFGSAATRQTRRRPRDDDDDDDRDDRGRDDDDDRSSSSDRTKAKRPVSRLRAGIEATNPKSDRSSRSRH